MSNFKGIVRCKTKSDYDGLTKDSDKLYIVDEETPATMLIEGTYSQITSIAQQSQLTKGSLYKITDYVCVNDELGNGTTGMPVGIILTAVSSNKFSEQCMACSTTVNSVSTETFAQSQSLENFDITEFSIKYSVNNDFSVTTTKGYIYSQCIQYGKGGGGGGATTLGFERINMHYVDEKDNLNGGVFSVGKSYKHYLLDEFKTTEDIFVEFVSTELPSEVEEKIGQGRFAIRFDYPTKFHKRNTYATLPTGAGNRSFAHNLYSNGGDDNVERGSQIRRYMQLHNSFYFVTSSDIKTKEDGTKYLHIKISVKDLMNKMFIISTSKSGGDAVYEANKLMDLTDLAKEYILDSYDGVPYVGGQMDQYPVSREAEYRPLTNQKLFETVSNGNFARILGTHPKEDKLFNCLFMLMSEEDSGIETPTFCSQFFRGDKFLERPSFYDISGYLGRFHFEEAENINARAKQNMSVVVKPRFCVLKEDWETIGNDGNGGSMFEKKYGQSEQSIIVRIPDTLCYDGEIIVLLPVFRIIISRYRRK